MICQTCGSTPPSGASFCTRCGSPVASIPVAAPDPAATPQPLPLLAGRAGAEPPGVPGEPAPIEEAALYRVGPFGISIRFGKPGLFATSMRNAVEVVLTDRRLCGVWKPPLLLKLVSRHRDPLYFNVPLAAVTAVEPVRFAAVHALWIHWAEGGARREVALEGALLRHGEIQRIYELLWARIPEAARISSAPRT